MFMTDKHKDTNSYIHTRLLSNPTLTHIANTHPLFDHTTTCFITSRHALSHQHTLCLLTQAFVTPTQTLFTTTQTLFTPTQTLFTPTHTIFHLTIDNVCLFAVNISCYHPKWTHISELVFPLVNPYSVRKISGIWF